MKARIVTSLSLIVALALLLPGGARSFAAQTLPATSVASVPQRNMWPQKLAAPLQPSGQCSSGLNPDLSFSGRARGQVLSVQGPVGANLRVQLQLPDGSVARETHTDEQGRYHFSDLPAGRYQLQVVDENGKPLALQAEVSLDIQPEPGQIPIESVLVLAALMPDGGPHSVGPLIAPARSEQPAGVQANGYITGVVTAADTGQPPHQTILVEAYDTTGIRQAYGYVDYFTGVYSITAPSGTYRVKFRPYSGNYAPEWYNNQRDFASATPVVVTDGAVTQNINAVLEVGGQIAGRVTAAAGGAPLQNVYVHAYTSTTSTSYEAYDYTDASGIYTITGLLTGTYYLEFTTYGSDYLTEYYDDKATLAAADGVSVALGGVVTGIDAVLKSASKITGRVTAADSGTPLNDVYVAVYAYRCSSFVWMDSATTNASGVYTVTGLLAGSYQVEFDPSSSSTSAMYVGEYYHDKKSLTTADPVAVADSSVTSGIDAALALGGQIAGRITAADGGSPLDDVWVDAYDGNGHYVGYGGTDATGVYTVTSLPAGTYRLDIYPSISGASAAYVEEYYNNRPTLATADPVNVTAGSVTSNINAALNRGGQITGQVTAADGGALLQGVSISVYDSNGDWAGSATTNASGVYTTSGLTTGNYRVQFRTQSAPGVTEDYVDEYYNDKSSLATANAVPVTAPNLTSGINAVLARGGKISGQVTATDTGGPLSGIRVSAYDSSGREVRYDYTDSSGNYAISGLPTGNYRVRFYGVCVYFSDSRTTKTYFGEYYNDKLSLATADSVAVTAPNTTSGINAVLAGGTLKSVYLPVVLR
jgi:5-hydroxyisourate hydrolase-like protein (transthyretin family)